MYSVAVVEPGKVAVVEVPALAPGPYDVITKTEVSFVCNLTDRKVIDGHMPGLGLENYPLLLGHESVGRVTEIGGLVKNFTVGQRVVGGLILHPPGSTYGSGWGGHSEYTLVKDHGAMTDDGVADEAHGWDPAYSVMLPVPDDIPAEAAALLCTWREVYSALVDDFSLKNTDEIIVFGGGPVGLSFTLFAKKLGFPYVACVDPNPERREKALAFGADDVFDRDDPALEDLVSRRGGPFDAVIDAVGRESVINQGLKLIGMGGKLCVYGVLPEPRVSMDVGSAPYNFSLLVHQWPSRAAEAAAHAPLIEWIRSGVLDHARFVTSSFRVADVAAAIAETYKKTNTKTMLIFDT
jgi:alcohol dehydrogenase